MAWSHAQNKFIFERVMMLQNYETILFRSSIWESQEVWPFQCNLHGQSQNMSYKKKLVTLPKFGSCEFQMNPWLIDDQIWFQMHKPSCSIGLCVFTRLKVQLEDFVLVPSQSSYILFCHILSFSNHEARCCTFGRLLKSHE